MPNGRTVMNDEDRTALWTRLLVAFLTECDRCCRDAVFCTLDGEQFCGECLKELDGK